MSEQLIKDVVDNRGQLARAVLNHTPRIIVDIYCRVSTEDQEDNTSLDEQERASREYCKEHNLIVGMVHRETFSGYYYREREKLSLMRERYLSGKIQGVVVRTYDRLSRKEVHFGILLEEIEHNGTQLYCVKEQLENTLIGRMTRMFLGFMAEWEREKIRDRTQTGRINKAKEGKVVVASSYKLIYWLDWHDPEKKDFPILNEERTKITQDLAEKYADGVPALALAKDLDQRNIPSPMAVAIAAGHKKRKDERGYGWNSTTIVNMLTDPRITGKDVVVFTNHDKGAEAPLEEVKLPDGTYPRVISDELHKRILERARINKEEASRKGLTPGLFLLRAGGFIKCQNGHAMTGIQKFDRYECPKCRCFVRRPKADEFAWSWAEKLAEHTEIIEEAIKLTTSDQKIAQETKSIDASLERWRAKAANYLEDLDDTTLRGDSRAAIREKLNEANLRIEQLETEQAQVLLGMIDKGREKAIYQEILDWCKRIREAKRDDGQEKPEELDYNKKRDFFRLLGLVVIVGKPLKKCGEPILKIGVELPKIQALIPQETASLQKLGPAPVGKYPGLYTFQ